MPYSPINLPTFDKPAVARDPFASLLSGYKPRQLEAGIQEKQLANLFQQAKVPYAQQMAGLDVLKKQRDVESPFSEFGKILKDYSNIDSEDTMARQLFEKYVQQKSLGTDHSTEIERLERMLSDPNIPEERKNIIRQLKGIQPEHEGRNYFKYARPGERNFLRKQNQEYLKRAEGAHKGLQTLDELDDLIKNNPNIGKYFVRALTSDKDRPSIMDQLIRQGLSEKELTAVQKFNKLTSQLVVNAGEAFGGGRRWTDATQKLIQDTKPFAGNTDEANRFVSNELRKILVPEAAEYNKVRDSVEKQYEYIPPAKNEFNQRAGDFSSALEENNPSGEMITIKNPKTGETRQISKEEFERHKRK